MSVYNIREKFVYNLTTSSIDYVRNYNFNTATVTNIPMLLTNLDDTLAMTVDMTTTDSWLRIVDPQTNKDLRYPSGNVVLQPSSSQLVYVKLDLPPDIESRPETVIYPSITFNLTSGSRLIVVPETTQGKPQNIIIAPTDINLNIGETQVVTIKTYDVTGNEEDGGQVEWKIENMSIAQLTYESTNVDSLDRRRVRGISPGTTRILYDANGKTAQTTVTVSTTITPGKTPSNIGSCGKQCTTDEDCSGECSYCAGGVCSDGKTGL
jgi:hypothetical protein